MTCATYQGFTEGRAAVSPTHQTGRTIRSDGSPLANMLVWWGWSQGRHQAIRSIPPHVRLVEAAGRSLTL